MTSDRSFIGRRLGSYQIEGLIGRGGMGEVYRARDTRLGRDVAIKILPAAFSEEPERLARFEREARLLAALNHPHIGAIYGVEEAGPSPGPGQASLPALVLELVDGETLADRVSRGALSLADALPIARQIADALDAAHERGIVHRDLKPANIKITRAGAVKVLDFGLAKDVAADAEPSDLSHSPTATFAGTRDGVILGTAAYMSPEQARGKVVDKRTDIWAFGCVLYQMLSGQPAFKGETVTDTLAAIIEREPKWEALPGATPAPIRDLLRRCLQKDATTRLRDIGDARTGIDEALAHRTRPRVPVMWRGAGVGAALLLVFAAAAFWWTRSERRIESDPSEWEQITSFPDSATQPALSPDGRILTFIRGPSTFQSQGQIYVKLMPNGEAVPLTSDTLTKMSPVFSPDGSRIAYTVNSEADPWSTWVVPTLRGKPSRWLQNASGLTWITPDSVLFSEVRPGTVGHMGIVTSTEGRTASRPVYFPPNDDGMAHRSALSPDGTSVLLVEMMGGTWIPCRLVPLAGGSKGKVVGPPGARCTGAVWSPDGKTMYFSADRGDGFHLWRQRFPDGEPEQILFGPGLQEGAAIAPDGRSLITSVGFRQRGVWIHDASGERQISGEGYAYYPLFARDGQTLCYRRSSVVSVGQSPTELWKMDLASGQAERLLPGQLISAYDLSRDDDRLLAAVVEADGKSRVWLAWLDGREPPRPIPGAEGDNPRFGAGGEIFFRAAEGNAMVLFRIDGDGGGRRKVSERSLNTVFGTVSPDGQWLGVTANVENRAVMLAFSTRDGVVVPIGPGAAVARLRWTPEGRRIALSVQVGEASAFSTGRTYVLPLRGDSMLPPVPEGGFRSETELAAIPGIEVLNYGDLALSPSNGIYAFSRETITRNLYRIPLH